MTSVPIGTDRRRPHPRCAERQPDAGQRSQTLADPARVVAAVDRHRARTLSGWPGVRGRTLLHSAHRPAAGTPPGRPTLQLPLQGTPRTAAPGPVCGHTERLGRTVGCAAREWRTAPRQARSLPETAAWPGRSQAKWRARSKVAPGPEEAQLAALERRRPERQPSPEPGGTLSGCFESRSPGLS